MNKEKDEPKIDERRREMAKDTEEEKGEGREGGGNAKRQGWRIMEKGDGR